jgi:hypothetical protein
VGIGDLRSLVGEWRGEGLLHGRPVQSRVVAAEFGPDMLRLDNETFRDGGTVHRERVLFRERDGRLEATTSPWRGDAQLFTAVEGDRGRTVLVCGSRYRWTIVIEGVEVWSETFEAADESGRLETVVSLRHVRA